VSDVQVRDPAETQDRIESLQSPSLKVLLGPPSYTGKEKNEKLKFLLSVSKSVCNGRNTIPSTKVETTLLGYMVRELNLKFWGKSDNY